MNLDENIQSIDDAIVRFGVAKKTLGILKSLDVPKGVRVSWLGERVILEVSDAEELHNARTYLREVFGSWNDKVGSITGSWGEYATAIYKSEDNNKVQIRMDFKVDDIPEGLKSDTCKFEKSTDVSYNYVCSKGA